jgi:hypothetical protein
MTSTDFLPNTTWKILLFYWKENVMLEVNENLVWKVGFPNLQPTKFRSGNADGPISILRGVLSSDQEYALPAVQSGMGRLI